MKPKFFIAFLFVGLIGFYACSSSDKEGEEEKLPPTVVCPQSSLNSILRGESVMVNISNIDDETEVTVKFGKETTLTRKGPGVVSYAFEKSGSKTITVTMEPAELEKTTFKLYVEKLMTLQALAYNLRKDPNLCLTMAHRANSSDFSIPENSLPAIEKCIEDQVDIVENDVYTTSDGVLVVSHDASIDRETTGSGTIANLTLDKIKSYNLKDRNGKATSEKMLTLDEYLEACKGRIYINIDIGDRNANIAEVVTAVEKKGMTDQVLVYCNNADKIRAAFQTNPLSNVYSWVSHATNLIDGGQDNYLYFTQCGWNPTTAAASRTGAVDSNKKPTTASTVAAAVAAGTLLTVNAIYTLNTNQLYPTSFPVAQVEDIFKTFPACQCIHVDTGKEAREALISYGKHVMEY